MNTNANQPLQGTRILIAEDDAILAFDLGITLQKAGAKILGPTLTLAHTLSLAQTAAMCAAVLDVSLRDEEVFPAAHELKGRGCRDRVLYRLRRRRAAEAGLARRTGAHEADPGAASCRGGPPGLASRRRSGRCLLSPHCERTAIGPTRRHGESIVAAAIMR